MPISRQLLTPVIAVACVLTGLDLTNQSWMNLANAQLRAPNSRQIQTPVPIIKLRSRTDAQSATASAGFPAQLPSARRFVRPSSIGAWPGPQSPASRPRFRVNRGFAANSGRIQQTAATDQFRLPPTGPVLLGTQRKRMRDYSWIHIDPPQPAEIKLHDIVTIIVDEKSEVIMNSKFNRQRTSKLKAELKEFVRLGQTGNLTNAAINAPSIDAQLQGTLNSTGQLTDQEGVKYRIAATVVDVLPNGVLQLEARKKIQTQDDVSEYTLTGELRATDVSPDNTASSENIASLNIVKHQNGRVYDATKRNWGYRLYDLLFPF